MMGRRGYDVRHRRPRRCRWSASATTAARRCRRAAAAAGRPTRELFDTLLLWKARVPLDADGEARVEVPLNDSLTSFRIVAVATGGAGSVRHRRDVDPLDAGPDAALRPAAAGARGRPLPRRVHACATPPSAPMDGRACARAIAGLAERRCRRSTLTLAPGEARDRRLGRRRAGRTSTTLRWDDRGAASAGGADATALARGAAGRRRRCRCARSRRRSLQLGAADSRCRSQRPADALPGRGGVDVALRADARRRARRRARLACARYPYTCLEQRVSRAVGARATRRAGSELMARAARRTSTATACSSTSRP